MEVFLQELIGELKPDSIASMIDHTLLKPDADYRQLEKYVEDVRKYKFHLLMIPLSLVERVREIAGNTIRLGVVVGFPLGNTSTKAKVAEAIEAAELKVAEIDMVMNINLFKSGRYDEVLKDIVEVTRAFKSAGGGVVKVIIETGLLSDDEKKKAVEIIHQAGADYVKTCTGFLGSVATPHDVYLLKVSSRGRLKVKAAGGIRRGMDALVLVAAGADRIGTSSGDKIVEDIMRLKGG